MRYLRLESSTSSMTYSTGVSTPARSGAAFSKKAMVRSLPGMSSSTSTPAGKRASCFSTNARSRERSSITDSWVMPFDVRLHDHRPAPAVQPELPDLLDELTARRDHAVLPEHELGEGLVEAHRQDPGVRPRVREAQLVEERGVERLAEPPPAALGGVEDEVGRERLEARGGAAGRPAHLDALDAVAEPLQGRGERVDGLARIELGFFLGIREAQVVRQGDAHASSGGPAFARSTAWAGGGSLTSFPRAAREAAS